MSKWNENERRKGIRPRRKTVREKGDVRRKVDKRHCPFCYHELAAHCLMTIMGPETKYGRCMTAGCKCLYEGAV